LIVRAAKAGFGRLHGTEVAILFHRMQIYDHQGKRLYLTADERRAFIAAAAETDALCAHCRQNGHTYYKNILVLRLGLEANASADV
jgi:hypothetical protein